MGKALMIAVDDSESSAYAVKFTLENLASSDDAITLVHVRSEVDVEGFYGTPDWVAEMNQKFEERARGILSNMKEIVDGHKGPISGAFFSPHFLKFTLRKQIDSLVQDQNSVFMDPQSDTWTVSRAFFKQ
ncbi:hypothetical protein SELMODRAFT_425355 [Selaginella moellendorffii]|uniref:UspA domain-containing protein n=1 Tax=Selaginella moellendorffii TaxID=88036 RepID=D8SSU3_SELML|nr:hypothetical protein SELMODRAFT_425355 [Selaginella moellendorffii]